VSIKHHGREDRIDAELPLAVATPEGLIGRTTHSLMDETVFKDANERMELSIDTQPETRRINLGSRVLNFVEAYALGDDVTPPNSHEQRIADFLDLLC
jgi:hypothetical protein